MKNCVILFVFFLLEGAVIAQDLTDSYSNNLPPPQDSPGVFYQIGDRKCDSNTVKDLLAQFNFYRSLHGAPSLVYSPTIAIDAQTSANRYAALNQLQPDYNSPQLVVRMNAQASTAGITVWAHQVMYQLIQYEQRYEVYYGHEPPKGFSDYKALAWSQLQWWESTQVGFGCTAVRALDGTGSVNWFFVAEFAPAGNGDCKFKRNVLPPKTNPLYTMLVRGGGRLTPDARCVAQETGSGTLPQGTPPPPPDSGDQYLMRGPQHSCNPAFQRDLLTQLNLIRAQHGSPPLQFTQSLASSAQSWANQLGSLDGLATADPNSPYGQILYKMWFPQSVGTQVSLPPSTPLEQFKSQAANYRFYGDELQPNLYSQINSVNYWSQLLWRATRRVGIGCALVNTITGTLGGMDFYLVYNFDPIGNQDCKFKQNVLPDINTALYQQLMQGGLHDPAPRCYT